MPLPKRPTAPAARKGTGGDSRFSNFETDPKFRLPSKKHAKTKLDARFSRLLTDPDFHSKSSVDRYGRRISPKSGRLELDRKFELGSEDELEDEDAQYTVKQKRKDAAVRRELAKVQERGLDPIRDGGLSSSSDESSSDEEDDNVDVEDQTELAGQDNQVPMGDVTARLAAVNMDWDNIRATDIMAVANSFVPGDGRILNVTIYPSEFGMERMQREEIEGPPKAIFAKANKKDMTTPAELDESASDTDEGDERAKDTSAKEGDEFDSKELRNYQLDRLRYYYAVLECSSPSVAKSIYDNMDGREYLSSANFFDLRFVPDNVDFDAEPHDQCDELPNDYKPNEFVTDALSHSKVKLTWDADDATRKEVQKRAFSRAEMDENELQAYIGTDSSSSEDEVEAAKSDKVANLRAALGLNSSSASHSKSKSSQKRNRDFKQPKGEMEITFTSGLSANSGKGSVFENEPEENTLEKYVRKQKERKAKRKERAVALKEGNSLETNPSLDEEETAQTNAGTDDPWNDPFFESDPEAKKAAKKVSNKAERAKKRVEREKQEQEVAAERANLELLMADEEGTKVQHFDMNEVIKAEKAKKKKGKKAKKAAKDIPEDTFEMNTNDPRFAKLYESHDFAIDPTNPRFKDTAGMKALLEEGRKKRKHGAEFEEPAQKKSKVPDSTSDDLKRLAARVKAKSKTSS